MSTQHHQPPFNAALGRFTNGDVGRDGEHGLPEGVASIPGAAITPRVLGSPAIMDHPQFSSAAFSDTAASTVTLPTPTQQYPQPSFGRKTLTLLSGNRITSSSASTGNTNSTSPSISSIATFSNPRGNLYGSSSTITSAQSRGTGVSVANHKTSASIHSTSRGLNAAQPASIDTQSGPAPYSHSLSFTPATASPRYNHSSAGSMVINHADRAGTGYGVTPVSRSIPISSSTATRSDTASERYFITVVPPPDFPSDSGAARRGTLVPLYPSLSSQLYAIARELSLPSIGGIALYLLDDGEGNPGPRVGDRSWNGLWKRHFEQEEAERMAVQAHRDAQVDEVRRIAARSDASWASRLSKRPAVPRADVSSTGPRSVEANSTAPQTSVSTSTSPTHRSKSTDEEEEHLADVPADSGNQIYADADETGLSSGLSASGAEFDGAGASYDTMSHDTTGSRASNQAGFHRQPSSVSTRRNVNGAGGFKSESSESAVSQDGRNVLVNAASRVPRQSAYRGGPTTRSNNNYGPDFPGPEQFSPGSNGLPIESHHSSLSFMNQALQGSTELPNTGAPSPHSPRASLYHAQSQARLYHSMSGSIQSLVPPAMSMLAAGTGLRLPIVARFEWTVERSRPAAGWWDVWCERERARIGQNASGVGSGRWTGGGGSQIYGQQPPPHLSTISREAGPRPEHMLVGDTPVAYPMSMSNGGSTADEPLPAMFSRSAAQQTGLVPSSDSSQAPRTPDVVLARRDTEAELGLSRGPHETSSNLGMLQHAPHSAPPANTAIGGAAVAAASLAAAAGAGEALNRAVHHQEEVRADAAFAVAEARAEPETPLRHPDHDEDDGWGRNRAVSDAPSSSATVVPSNWRSPCTRGFQQTAFVFPPTPPSHLAAEKVSPVEEGTDVPAEEQEEDEDEEEAVVESREVDAALPEVHAQLASDDAQEPAEVSGASTLTPSAALELALDQSVDSEVLPEHESPVPPTELPLVEPVDSEALRGEETHDFADELGLEPVVHSEWLPDEDTRVDSTELAHEPEVHSEALPEEETRDISAEVAPHQLIHSEALSDDETRIEDMIESEVQSMDALHDDYHDDLVLSGGDQDEVGGEPESVAETEPIHNHFLVAQEDLHPQSQEVAFENDSHDAPIEAAQVLAGREIEEPVADFEQRGPEPESSRPEHISIVEPESHDYPNGSYASQFAFASPIPETEPLSRNLSISSESRPRSADSDRELVLKQRQQAREAVRLQLQREQENAQSISLQRGTPPLHADLTAEVVLTPSEEIPEMLHQGQTRESEDAVDQHVDDVEAAFREMQAQPEDSQLATMPLVLAAHDVLGPPPVSATAEDAFQQNLIPGGAVASVNASAVDDTEILAVQPPLPTHSFEVGDVVPFRDIDLYAEGAHAAEVSDVQAHTRSAVAEHFDEEGASELAYEQDAASELSHGVVPPTVEIMPSVAQEQRPIPDHAPEQYEGHPGAEIIAGTSGLAFEPPQDMDLTPRTEAKEHIIMSGWTVEPVSSALPPPPLPPRDVSTDEEAEFNSTRFSGSSQRPRREPPPPPPRRALPQASPRFVAPTMSSPQMMASPLGEILQDQNSLPAMPRSSLPSDVSEDFFASSDQAPIDVLPAHYPVNSNSALVAGPGAESGEERLERQRDETLAALEGNEEAEGVATAGETPTLLMQHVMGLVSSTGQPTDETGENKSDSSAMSEEEEALEVAKKEQRREAAALDASEPLTMPVFAPELALSAAAAPSSETDSASDRAVPTADNTADTAGADQSAFSASDESSLPPIPPVSDRISALVRRPVSIQSVQSSDSVSTLRAIEHEAPMAALSEDFQTEGASTPRALEEEPRAVPPPPVPPRSPFVPEQQVEEVFAPEQERALPPPPPARLPPSVPPKPEDDMLAQLALQSQRPVPPPPIQTDRQPRPYLRDDEDADSDSSGASTPIREDPNEDEAAADARRTAAIAARLAARNQERAWLSRPTRKLFGFGFGRKRSPFPTEQDQTRASSGGQDEDDSSSEEEGDEEEVEEEPEVQVGQAVDEVAVKEPDSSNDQPQDLPVETDAASEGASRSDVPTELVAHTMTESEPVQTDAQSKLAETTVDQPAVSGIEEQDSTPTMPTVEWEPTHSAAENVIATDLSTAQRGQSATPIEPTADATPAPPTRSPPAPPPKEYISEVEMADKGEVAPEAKSEVTALPVDQVGLHDESIEDADGAFEEDEDSSTDAEEAQTIVDDEDLVRRDAAILSRLEARNKQRGWMFRPSHLLNFGGLGRKRSAPLFGSSAGQERGGADEDDSSSDDDNVGKDEAFGAEEGVEEADQSVADPAVGHQDSTEVLAEPAPTDAVHNRQPSELSVSDLAESEYSEARAGTDDHMTQDEPLASEPSLPLLSEDLQQEEDGQDHGRQESADQSDDGFVAHNRLLRASQVPQDAFLDEEHDDNTFVYSHSRVSTQDEGSEEDRDDNDDHEHEAGGETINIDHAFEGVRLPGGYVPMNDFIDEADDQDYHDGDRTADADRRPFSVSEGREGDQASAMSSSHDDAFSLEHGVVPRAARESTLSLSPQMRSRPLSGVERESIFGDDDGNGQVYLEVPSESDHAWTPSGSSANTPFEFDEYSTPAGEMEDDPFEEHAGDDDYNDDDDDDQGDDGAREGHQRTPQLGDATFSAAPTDPATLAPADAAPAFDQASLPNESRYTNHSQDSSFSLSGDQGVPMAAQHLPDEMDDDEGDEPHWTQVLQQSRFSASSAGHFDSATSQRSQSVATGPFSSFDTAHTSPSSEPQYR
ncbi:unnamed protein product [Tilletia laevis]|nr:unnamed protein product [Tilletia laevis]